MPDAEPAGQAFRFVRMYTAGTGHTKFADVEIPGPAVWAEGVRNHMLRDIPASTVNIIELLDWRPRLAPHPPPRRQWVIILRGAMEISTMDGERRRFQPGDCLLAEDMDGTGHQTDDVGDERLVTLNIGVPDDWRTPRGFTMEALLGYTLNSILVAARASARAATRPSASAKEFSAVSDSTPTVEVILQGYSLDTNVGLAGFCTVTLVEGVDANGERKRILFDPAHVGRRVVLYDALAKRGLGPKDIDAVVLSHSHWDHIQNIDVFSHAPLLIHPYERRYSLEPHVNDWATPAWTGAILERQKLIEVCEGDQLLQGVRVMDMPGHTPGGIGLTVEAADGLSVVTGDALHHAKLIAIGENPLIFWDRKAAADTIARVAEIADVIVPGHDRAFRLTRDKKIEYIEDFQMSLYNVADGLQQLDWIEPQPSQYIMPGIEEQRAAFAEFERVAAARAGQVAAPSGDGWVQWQEVDPEGPNR